MTDTKQSSSATAGAELKEDELAQVQAGTAATRHGASSPQAKPTSRRATAAGRFDYDLQLP